MEILVKEWKMKRVVICVFSVLCLAALLHAGPVTFDFRTSSLVNTAGGNNEPSIGPVLAQLQSMGLTLTTVGGLGFNVGCGYTTGNCLGADQSSVDDFAGHIHGLFTAPSGTFGIMEANNVSLVNLYDAGSSFIGSYSSTFNYSGAPVSFFDVFLSYDAMYTITFNPSTATPEPGTLGMLGAGLLGVAFLLRRKFMM
jgi:hypothetical protein